MDEWSGLVGLVSILIPCLLKFASRILISVDWNRVIIYFDLFWRASHFGPTLPLSYRLRTRHLVACSSPSCRAKGPGTSPIVHNCCMHWWLHWRKPHLLGPRSANIHSEASKRVATSRTSHRRWWQNSVRSGCSWHKVSLCGVWQENLNSFEFDGYRHDLMLIQCWFMLPL